MWFWNDFNSKPPKGNSKRKKKHNERNIPKIKISKSRRNTMLTENSRLKFFFFDSLYVFMRYRFISLIIFFRNQHKIAALLNPLHAYYHFGIHNKNGQMYPKDIGWNGKLTMGKYVCVCCLNSRYINSAHKYTLAHTHTHSYATQ